MANDKRAVDFPISDDEIKELEEIEALGKPIMNTDIAEKFLSFDQEDIEAIDAMVEQAFAETDSEMQ